MPHQHCKQRERLHYIVSHQVDLYLPGLHQQQENTRSRSRHSKVKGTHHSYFVSHKNIIIAELKVVFIVKLCVLTSNGTFYLLFYLQVTTISNLSAFQKYYVGIVASALALVNISPTFIYCGQHMMNVVLNVIMCLCDSLVSGLSVGCRQSYICGDQGCVFSNGTRSRRRGQYDSMLPS